METKDIDFEKLNEAVEIFGSLQRANDQLEKNKLALEKKTIQRSKRMTICQQPVISWLVK